MPSAPHSHFWPDRGVRGAAELDDVDRDRARALRAVEDHRHVDARRARPARSRRVCQLTCEQATSVVLRPDRVGEVGERHRADLRAALARRDQRPDQARVLLVGGDDLVAGPDVEPGQHLADPLARRRRERDVGDVAAEQLGVAGAQLVLSSKRRSKCGYPRPSSSSTASSRCGGLLRGRAATGPWCRRSGTRPARGSGYSRAQRGQAHGRAQDGAYWPQTGQGERALPRVELRGAAVLLGLGGRGGVAGAADALPRLLRELVLAVEPVAGVRRRVAAGLAGGDRLEVGRRWPARAARRGRAGARCARA